MAVVAGRKVAWVIGGGTGIGAAVTAKLVAEGWTVAISGRRAEKLAETANGTTILPFPVDVTDEATVKACVAEIVARLGKIDMVLFGAAAWQPMNLGDYAAEKFGNVVNTNLLGAVRVVDAALPVLRRQGFGQIALIASVAGYFGLPRAAAYGTTKAAMIHFAQVMRAELARDGLDVRVVCPGFVKSDLTDKNDFPMPFLMETDEAATHIVDGLLRSKRFEIAFPWQMVWILKGLGKLPYWLALRFTARLVDSDAARPQHAHSED